MSTSRSMYRKILQQILIIVLLMLALFSILEGASRIWGPQLLPADHSKKVAPGQSLHNEPNLIGDALLGWRVREGRNRQFGVPDMTQINSRGLREGEIPFEAKDKRILIVGDSSIYGVRVRDTENISGQLETMLRKNGLEWSVLNGGCPGYSSWQVERLLRERLLEYKPDWVIVGTLWSDSQGADQPDATQYGAVPMSWRYKSRLLLLLNSWYSARRWTVEGAPEVSFGLGAVLAPTHRVPISDYEENLLKINELVVKNGAKTAFLLLPSIQDVEYGRVADFREGYREVMRKVAQKLDAPIADMPSSFYQVGREQEYFMDDVHPTVKGYRIIAEELTKVLSPYLQ